jgi:hypothetical protein
MRANTNVNAVPINACLEKSSIGCLPYRDAIFIKKKNVNGTAHMKANTLKKAGLFSP